MIPTHVRIISCPVMNLSILFCFSFSQVPITQILKDLRKRRSLALYSWVVLECVRGKKEENEREEEEVEEEGAAAVWLEWVEQAQAVVATPRVHLPCQIGRRDQDLHLHQPPIFTMTWPKRENTNLHHDHYTDFYFIIIDFRAGFIFCMCVSSWSLSWIVIGINLL